MPNLPSRPELEQLRRRAKDLLRAARGGDAAALRRIRAVSDRLVLASAQLAVAREYGFASWPTLRIEVLRREVLDRGDAARLRALLGDDPGLAVASLANWCDHPKGASPLSYVAMMRYDTSRRVWRDVPGAATLARVLIEAGAPVDGEPGDRETPLITAASYGDAAVARVLIEAGADIDARVALNSGGVPGATALRHAAVFGMTDVIDVLIGAGAQAADLAEAAAAGDLDGHRTAQSALGERVRALVMAADHQRLAVIDELLAAGTPIDETDAKWGRQPLRLAAQNGRVASVEHLLARGADPNLRDAQHGLTPLDCCRRARAGAVDQRSHDRVEAMLEHVTSAV